MASAIGCSTDWTAEAYDRFTGRTEPLVASRIRCGWAENEMTSATVTVPAQCRDAALGLVSWRHLIRIRRDAELMWLGPLTGRSRSVNGDVVQLNANDLFAFAKKRRLRSTRALSGDPAALLLGVLKESLGHPSDPVAFAARIEPTGLTRSVAWDAADQPFAWRVIEDLIAASLRVSMIGDTLHGTARSVSRKPRATLTERHLEGRFDIVEDGWQIASSVALRGQTGAVFPPEIAAPVAGPHGLLDSALDRTDAQTAGNATELAREAWARTRAARVDLVANGDTRILPGAPVSTTDLIPGTPHLVDLEDNTGRFSRVFTVAATEFVIGSGGAHSRTGDGRFSSTANAETEQISVRWSDAA